MHRISRVVIPEHPHHITQRGNNQQDVFIDDTDRKKYLLLINEYSQRYGITILSYCLMSNHVHFIVVPKTKESLSRTFNFAHVQYSKYYNHKKNLKGHLWQNRFYSCVLDEKHLICAARYIERNPARASIVKNPSEWEWSSASYNCGLCANNIIKLGNLFDYTYVNKEGWNEYICSSETTDEVDAIKKCTLNGRPLGASTFVEGLETRLGRRLQALPRGRQSRK